MQVKNKSKIKIAILIAIAVLFNFVHLEVYANQPELISSKNSIIEGKKLIKYFGSKRNVDFLNDNSLTGIETIEKNSFSERAVDKLILKDSIKSIGDMAFQNSKIEYLHIGNENIVLGNYIFKDSYHLRYVSSFKEIKAQNIADDFFVTKLEIKGNNKPLYIAYRKSGQFKRQQIIVEAIKNAKVIKETDLTNKRMIFKTDKNQNAKFNFNADSQVLYLELKELPKLSIDLEINSTDVLEYKNLFYEESGGYLTKKLDTTTDIELRDMNGALVIKKTFSNNNFKEKINNIYPELYELTVSKNGFKTQRHLLDLSAQTNPFSKKINLEVGIDFNIDNNNTLISYNGFLSDIEIPDKIEIKYSNNITKTYNISKIAKDAFKSIVPFNKITSLKLGQKISEISENAFFGNKIASLVLGENTKVGRAAFYGNNIKTLEIPYYENESEAVIMPYAFARNKISNLNIPYINKISEAAFMDNDISNLNLNDKVKNIETLAFAANRLKNVVIRSSEAIIADYAFKGSLPGDLEYIISKSNFNREKQFTQNSDKIKKAKNINISLTDMFKVKVNDMYVLTNVFDKTSLETAVNKLIDTNETNKAKLFLDEKLENEYQGVYKELLYARYEKNFNFRVNFETGTKIEIKDINQNIISPKEIKETSSVYKLKYGKYFLKASKDKKEDLNKVLVIIKDDEISIKLNEKRYALDLNSNVKSTKFRVSKKTGQNIEVQKLSKDGIYYLERGEYTIKAYAKSYHDKEETINIIDRDIQKTINLQKINYSIYLLPKNHSGVNSLKDINTVVYNKSGTKLNLSKDTFIDDRAYYKIDTNSSDEIDVLSKKQGMIRFKHKAKISSMNELSEYLDDVFEFKSEKALEISYIKEDDSNKNNKLFVSFSKNQKPDSIELYDQNSKLISKDDYGPLHLQAGNYKIVAKKQGHNDIIRNLVMGNESKHILLSNFEKKLSSFSLNIDTISKFDKYQILSSNGEIQDSLADGSFILESGKYKYVVYSDEGTKMGEFEIKSGPKIVNVNLKKAKLNLIFDKAYPELKLEIRAYGNSAVIKESKLSTVDINNTKLPKYEFHLEKGIYIAKYSAKSHKEKESQIIIDNIKEITKKLNFETDTYLVEFILPYKEAYVNVYDSNKNKIMPNIEGKYNLPNGNYSYEVISQKYKTVKNNFIVNQVSTIIKLDELDFMKKLYKLNLNLEQGSYYKIYDDFGEELNLAQENIQKIASGYVLELETGKYRINLSKDSYETHEYTIVLDSDKTINYKPAKITSIPDRKSIFRLNGINANEFKILKNNIGQKPDENGEYILDAGEYQVDIQRAGYKPMSLKLTLSANEKKVLFVEDLEKTKITLEIVTDPKDAKVELFDANTTSINHNSNKFILNASGKYRLIIKKENYHTIDEFILLNKDTKLEKKLAKMRTNLIIENILKTDSIQIKEKNSKLENPKIEYLANNKARINLELGEYSIIANRINHNQIVQIVKIEKNKEAKLVLNFVKTGYSPLPSYNPVVPYTPSVPHTPSKSKKDSTKKKQEDKEKDRIIFAILKENIKDPNDYTDIDKNSWYYDGVKFVSESGYMNGVSDTKFAPNKNLSRAALATILHRLESKPKAKLSSFKDVVRPSWYARAVDWAAEKVIVKGFDRNIFAPNLNLTREQLVTILYRFARYKGMETTNTINIDDFVDAKYISYWAKDAMKWAVADEIIKGNKSKLNPQDSATRAEIAVIIQRFINLAEK